MIFKKLYEKTISFAHHSFATPILCFVSFIESSFFVVPPDVLLIPMALAKKNKALFYALLTTIFSVLGGIFGYIIGTEFIELVIPYLDKLNYLNAYNRSALFFGDYGAYAILIAGFSPLPYKIFTIAAGAYKMSFASFVIFSFIGRGARFFLIAILVKIYGVKIEYAINKYIEQISWFVIALVLLYIFYKTIL